MSNSDAYLMVLSLVSGSILTTLLSVYLLLTNKLLKWYVHRGVARIKQIYSRPRPSPLYQVLAAGDAVVCVSWRVVLACYLLPVLFVLVPIALAIGTFMLSATLIQPAP